MYSLSDGPVFGNITHRANSFVSDAGSNGELTGECGETGKEFASETKGVDIHDIIKGCDLVSTMRFCHYPD